ncbi:MAG: BLUF domain-containing protein [Alphaproteobacteria bacterium]|nr:BLUF domain-containing protein [Alphaproteobacteria bacterium]MBV9371195.1 BLUF domain-containing protein [Alphaproteobacteria bacterium]MBV9899925.1 BLUF domain-containing protein [Alphaproteobacteria bacterium]
MGLKTLTYTSRASIDIKARDVLDIHQIALELNALDGITGLLAFDGTRFLQILEGAPEAIDDLMARLHADRRHSAIEIRHEQAIARRSFPEWSMQLVRVSAGYLRARAELGSVLPPGVAPGVRALILGMSDGLSRSFEME